MVLKMDVASDLVWKKHFPEAKKVLMKAAKAAFKACVTDAFPAKNAEISFLLTTDDEIQKLNKQYRHMDKPTNVLSFASMDDEDGEPIVDDCLMLGDVVIALETTQREALENGRDFADHFSHLVVHGVLHLMGFDHEENDDAEEMEALEIIVLKGLNIENPYADASAC